MPASLDPPRTRRSLIRTAAAGIAGFALGALGRPEAASGTSATMLYGVDNLSDVDDTGLFSSHAVRTLRLRNTGTGKALEASAVYNSAIAVYGVNPSGYGVIGDTAGGAELGNIGVWGRDLGGTSFPVVGAAGTSAYGVGVIGYVHPDSAVTGPPIPGDAHVGVYGYAPSGTGVVASSETGTALQTHGKARFSRSGRVSVPKGRAYVDVDLRTNGGLGGSPLCFANILTRRPGVHIETVRPNYPATGKLRIYLNKVASSTTSTTIAWVVFG